LASIHQLSFTFIPKSDHLSEDVLHKEGGLQLKMEFKKYENSAELRYPRVHSSVKDEGCRSEVRVTAFFVRRDIKASIA